MNAAAASSGRRPRRRGLDDAISRLHEPGAQNRPDIARVFEPREVRGDDPEIRLARQDGAHVVASLEARRDHRLDEGRDERTRGVDVNRAIEPDDPAKRRERIRLTCVDVRIGEGVAGRNPARVGVLDHDSRRLGELERNARGGVEIQQVRERQFLPLMDLGRGETMTGRIRPRRWRLAGGGVPGGRLMRILAVAQIAPLDEPGRPVGREERVTAGRIAQKPLVTVHGDLSQRRRDRRVISRGVGKSASRQIEPHRQRRTARDRQRVEHPVVVSRVDDDEHVAKILGGRAHQAGPADVDLLDQVVEGQVRARRGPGERIQVDRHQVDWRDAMRCERREIVGAMTPREDPAVHLRVQGLDAPVHHLGEAGHLGDADHAKARLSQRLRGAAGRHQLPSACLQGARKRDQTGFVGHTQQCTQTRSELGLWNNFRDSGVSWGTDSGQFRAAPNSGPS